MPLPRRFRRAAERLVEGAGLRPHLRRDLPTQTQDEYGDVRILRDVEIPMRDGVVLGSDVYFPAGPPLLEARRPARREPLPRSIWPTLVTRTPYGRRNAESGAQAEGRYWARKGYAFVAQDVRGLHGSEGRFAPFSQEPGDGYDTLDWIARQPWCEGSVGALGASYAGYCVWAVAGSGHPSLGAVAFGQTAADLYGVWAYHGGVFCLSTMGVWAFSHAGRNDVDPAQLDGLVEPLVEAAAAAGHPNPFWTAILSHPCRDAFWSPLTLVEDYGKVRVPALHWSGWYDVFVRGALEGWLGVSQHSESSRARRSQWLVVSPDDHSLTVERTGTIGSLPAPGVGYLRDHVHLFFDHVLKRRENGWSRRPPIEIYVAGRGTWRFEHEWPLARTDWQRWYLRSGGAATTAAGDGVLSTVDPAASGAGASAASSLSRPPEAPGDEYVYDPADPVSHWVGRSPWEMARHLEDRTDVEGRRDVLCYTSEPLDAETEVTGPLRLVLWVASSRPDTDFTAALVDVAPGGDTRLIQEGAARASRCRGGSSPVPLQPDRPAKLTVDMNATSYLVAAGHRLRLEVSSSAFDRYERNLNSGGVPALSSDPVPAVNRVLHSAEHPSHLMLPVVPSAPATSSPLDRR
jgi:putative CocE/NonD family hydrolase